MKIFLSILAIIFVILIGTLFYYGTFQAISFEQKPVSEMVMVYDNYVGPYDGIAKVQMDIYKKLKDAKIETFKGIGIYYDNPQKVEKSKLRSKGGCLLEAKDYDKISELSKNFKVQKFNQFQAVVTEFPFKGWPSVMIGIFKVYPKFTKIYAQNSLFTDIQASIEIYDMPGKKIIYIFPAEKIE